MKIFIFKNGRPSSKPESNRAPAAPSTAPSSTPAAKSALKAQSSGPAKNLSKPTKKDKLPEAVEKMPEGKFKEFARVTIDLGKQYGLPEDSPIIKLAVTFCVLMGKYAHLVDRVPGNYRKSLDKDKNLMNQQFSDKQKKGLIERMSQEISGDYKDFHALYDSYKSKIKLNDSMASTLFVSYMLFGSQGDVEHFTNHKILAARLAHERNLYKDSTLISLKKQKTIPKGTVIFFSKNLKSGVIAAYATGNRQEFRYFVPGSKEPRMFQLDSTNSPVKTTLNLLSAFVPTTLPEEKPSETPKITQEKLDISKLEKEVKAQMSNKNIVEKYEKIGKLLFSTMDKLIKKKTQDPKYEELFERFMGLARLVFEEFEKDLRKLANSDKPVPPRLRATVKKFREYMNKSTR